MRIFLDFMGFTLGILLMGVVFVFAFPMLYHIYKDNMKNPNYIQHKLKD